MLDDRQWADLVETRVFHPERVEEAAAARSRPKRRTAEDGRLVLIAADHPARGALRAGPDRMAMSDRRDLLGRLCVALARPGVDGVLGTADVIDDLLLLGALEDKVVIGSMNRGGLAGTSFEIDDRFTGCSADEIERAGWQGGKMLFRIDPDDPATASTMEACGRAVAELAERGLMSMVEPFISRRIDGRVSNDLSTDAVVRSCTVAAGLGGNSAHLWLKLPVVEGMAEVLAATSLPVLLLGGPVSSHQAKTFETWRAALEHPTARGLVAGRTLLFPPDGDVASAVDSAVSLVR
ncbi:hypothetical protein [Nocardioides sp. YIM 152315]|uniref:Cgl0159 family (beta/alpha)8-fold protein n=1 Tax=Nocardioides sp. YIM 152315 TaxID=3031760 RepID=UPI0023DC3284|nr:hypothetical protein [Nocardioides sp. YIM 152315]MDF1605472.1 hypothetical protein [Nocardioides sp. YIM 152315]